MIGVKKIFDGKKVGYICLAIAVLNKSIIAFLFSSLKGDKSLYLLLAKNFLQTGKLAEAVSIVENGTTVYLYDPAIHSPLYSFLCLPFLWLTQSYFITQFIVSFLGWVIFFTGLYKIALLVFKQQWTTNIFILCTGFFLYPHELSSGPKDTLAVGFTLWGIVLIYQLITNRPSWKITVLLAFVLSCLALIKFLYIPITALLLCMALIFLVVKRTTLYLKQAVLLISLIFLAGITVHAFVFNPVYQLRANNIIQPLASTLIVNGFYPENLRHTFPFISSSYSNTELWSVQIEKIAGVSFGKAMGLFFLLDVFSLAGLLFACIIFFKRIIQHKIILLLVMASFTITGVVMYLSLTEKPLVYQAASGSWTYVSEARSFLLAMLTVQLMAFLFIFQYAGLRVLRYALLTLFLFAASHGLYFTIKHMVMAPAPQGAKLDNDALTEITALLKEEANAGSKLVLVTSDRALRRYAQLQELPVYTFTNLSPQLSWMRKGDRFLIATYKSDSLLLKKLPSEELIMADTIQPFIMHRLIVK